MFFYLTIFIQTVNILEKVKIWDVKKEMLVEASIIELTRNIAQTKIDGKWWKLEEVLTSERKKENDNNWNWTKNVGSHRNQLLSECVAIQSSENEIEGAMIVRFDVKSRIDIGKGCVYVDLLASSPRNRDWLVSEPVYKGIGSELFTDGKRIKKILFCKLLLILSLFYLSAFV